ncbi:MAG: sugar nucleotide-binding protein [Candidatus Pacebacteria bacterium]|nr:sugar nucleotide-binding protein [Candidatus Paceibacterota bacterium]
MKGFHQKQRVLVVGGGTLAQALEKSFSLSGISTFRAGRNPGPWHLDLSRDPGCWNAPGDLDWVFVCAGMTSRVECEKQPHLSRWINVGGSVRLARHFLSRGARVVFFGTDLSPKAGEYAKQKEELRRQLAQLPGTVWIRLGKVVHPRLPLLESWKDSLAQGTPIEAFESVRIFPVSPESIAEGCLHLVASRQRPATELVWQTAKSMTYVEIAQKWGNFLGYPASRIRILEKNSPLEAWTPYPVFPSKEYEAILGGVDRNAWWNI